MDEEGVVEGCLGEGEVAGEYGTGPDGGHTSSPRLYLQSRGPRAAKMSTRKDKSLPTNFPPAQTIGQEIGAITGPVSRPLHSKRPSS